MQNIVRTGVATGDEVRLVVERISNVLKGAKPEAVIIGLTACLFIFQKPDIDHEELEASIFETTKLVAELLSGDEGYALVDGLSGFNPKDLN